MTPDPFPRSRRHPRVAATLALLASSAALDALHTSHAQDQPEVRQAPHHAAHNATHRSSHHAAHMAASIEGMNGMYMGGARASDAEEISVTGKHFSPIRRAAARLISIPGGTSVIDSKMVLKQRNATTADLLKFQPGVYAEAPCGADDIRLSIRGSGLQVGLNATRAGILMLFDDLPMTTPIGSFNELLEPLGLQYTEILRGGNGFDLGSLQLGGAINFHSFTGYDAKTYQARLEAGSFGYLKEQVSSGKVIGKSDYYISVTNSYRSGYQQQTKATSFGINFNYGYRFNDNVDTRIFFRYRQTYEGNPYYLTRDQIAQNPRQAQYPYSTWNTYTIEPGTKYVGDRTTIRIDEHSKLIVGFSYIDAPMNHQLGNTASIYNNFYANGVVKYTRSDKILGHHSDTTIGVYTTHDLGGNDILNKVRRTEAYPTTPLGTVLTKTKLGGSSTVFHVSNNTEIFKNFWLTEGGALSYDPRSGSVISPIQNHFSSKPLYFAPRGGFRYQITPDMRVYGNVTRSVQAAQDWQFLSGALFQSGAAKGLTQGWQNLKPQTATTFEIGTEGTIAGQQWSLSYYHSAVRNELLSVVTPTSQLFNSAVLSNASPTTHQGVEIGLHDTLYEKNGNIISLLQSYTFQDLRYNHDPVFHNNRLPGIPPQFYQGELHGDFRNGLYMIADAEVASSTMASYDNRAKAAPYHIYNYTIGYLRPNTSQRVYLEFHNLANKHYATGVVPVYSSANGQAAALLPGDGFGIFGGIDVGFN